MGLPGVDSAVVRDPGAIRFGVFGQAERDPLILYQFGNLVGPIVGRRDAFHFGVGWDASDRASVRLVLPAFLQSGGEIPDLSADGFGMGDLDVAATLRALTAGSLTLGFQPGVTLPTGRGAAWMGEDYVRTAGTGLVSLGLGRFDAMLDLGVVFRTAVETEEDFELGSEFATAGGLRFQVLPEKLALYAVTVSRTPLARPFAAGAQSPMESLAGIEARPLAGLTLDAGLGRGWTAGYGTTEGRMLAGVTWRIPRKTVAPPPSPEVKVTRTEPPPVPPPPPVKVETQWKPGQLAKVKGQQIVIKDPIHFEFGTDHILPESIPTLRAVATILANNDRIAHLVIVGHASEEGSYAYNYDLSIKRARAVWEQLILDGTNPERISYRGMGEVMPLSQKTDEASLAANRRVEFHIVRQLDPLDPPLHYRSVPRLPWNGEPISEATAGSSHIAGGQGGHGLKPAPAKDDSPAPPEDETPPAEEDEGAVEENR